MFGTSAVVFDHVFLQLGQLLLLGSLSFGLVAYLPAVRARVSSRYRRTLRLRTYRRVLGWNWVALLLIWIVLGLRLQPIFPGSIPAEPMRFAVVLMVVTFVQFLAEFAFLMRIHEALADMKTFLARWLEGWLRLVLRLQLALVLVLATLDAAGDVLP